MLTSQERLYVLCNWVERNMCISASAKINSKILAKIQYHAFLNDIKDAKLKMVICTALQSLSMT